MLAPNSLLVAIVPLVALAAAEQITSLQQLNTALAGSGNRKIGFLSQANYDSVHNVLPSSVVVEICDSKHPTCKGTQDLISHIKDGTFRAGLISGLPVKAEEPFLNTFSSTVVSTRAMFMAPAASTEQPHGTTTTAASSYDLSLAVDAAIVSLQRAGKDEAARLANLPFEFMAVHTCKGSDLSAFPVPNRSAATGLLRSVLDARELKIAALGPYNWGGNDGNYKVTPYKGFYPDWLTHFCDFFNGLSGPDGVKYNSAGTITCKRVWQLASSKVFKDIFDGAAHVTEPYFIVDGFYSGTGESCTGDADCRPARAASGRETCAVDAKDNTKKLCTHAKSPRARHFRSSCTTIGVDSTFMTKKVGVSAAKDDDDGLPAKTLALIAGLVVFGVCCVASTCFAGALVRRERSGKPMFSAFIESRDRSNQPPQEIGSGRENNA